MQTMKDEAAKDIQRKASLTDRLLFWSLCIIFFFLPIATSPAVIAGALFLSIWILSGRFLKYRDWLNQEWTKPVLVFMLLPWVGLVWTSDVKTGYDFATKSYYWLYAFAIATLSLSAHSIKTLLTMFIAGLLFGSLIFLLQISDVIPLVKWLPTIYARSITASLLLVFAMLTLSFYFSKAKEITAKALIISLMLVFFVTLSMHTGRAGYLAFILLAPLMIYTLLGQKHLIKITAISILLIGAMFLFPAVQSRTTLAVEEIKAYLHGMDPNTSVGLRLNMWNGAIRIFLDSPVLGTGTGGYQFVMKKYNHPKVIDLPVQPHNSFLYMAASFGIIGLLSLFWLFLVFLQKGWLHRNEIGGFLILSFGLVLLIGSLTDTQILSLATAKMFALLMGLRIGENGK